MKKLISFFLSVVMLVSVFASVDLSAYADTSGDFEYSVSGSNATITKYTGSATSVTIPSKIGSYTVTSIGGYAFEYCSSLTSVTIPNSVISIGSSAFERCTSLTSITIPNSVTSIGARAFQFCTSLTSVTIGNSVTSISNYAFHYCTSLTSVTIGNSVTRIGNYAFEYCSSLTSVTIPNSVTSIGSNAFYRVNNIEYHGSASGSPWGAKSVNGYVDGYLVYKDSTKKELLGCSSQATSVTIPDSVTSIGNYAFYKCVSLTSVTIPNSVTSIGYCAFYNCSSLTTIYILNKNCNIYKDSNTIPDSTTIYGLNGSTAQSYANSYEKTFKIINNCNDFGLEHSESYVQNTNNVVSSTCTESGSYDVENRCKNCNTVISCETFITEEPLGHSFTNYISNEDATCTENGTKTAKCDRCDETDTITDEGTALGHIESEVQIENRIESTCQKEGSYDEVIYCLRCNEELSRNTKTIDKCHKYSLVSVIEPSCIEDGFNIYQCNFCEQFYTEQIEPLGHEVVIDEAIEPSCTETGLTEGSHCSRCNTVIVKQVSVQKLPHNYTSYTTNATCTEQGYITYTCTRCDESYTEITSEPLGHNVVFDAAVEPTCTTTGLTEGSHCSVCNMVLTKQEIIEALGHSYVLTRTSATCTSNGFNIYTCSACKTLKTEVQEALGHEYEITTNIPPTVTEDGYVIYTCTRCDHSYTEVIPATGETHTHTWGEWSYNGDAVYVSATEYTDGTATRSCTECGETETKTIEGTGLLRARTATCEFASEVRAMLGVKTELTKLFSNVYCKFTREDGKEFVVNSDKSTLSQDKNTAYYPFAITPQSLHSDIKVQFYAVTNDGITVWGQEFTYNMMDNYIKKQIANTTNESWRKLLVELVYYGYENQIKSGWKLDQLLIDELTEEQKALHSTETLTLNKYLNTSYVVCENPLTSWRSVNLEFGASTNPVFRTRALALTDDIKAVVTIEGDEKVYTYNYSDPDDAKYFKVDADVASDTTGIYFTFGELPAKRLRSKIYVTLYKGDTPITNTLEYSAETYCNSQSGKDPNMTEQNTRITQQLMRYGNAARAYFGI